MDRPTAQLVRQILPQVQWRSRGFPPPADATDPDPMQFQVDLAADYVEVVTGRTLDASMPPNLARTAQMAVALRVVQQLASFTDEQLSSLTELDVLAAWSTDGYSETFRDTGVATKAQNEARLINPWPPLNQLLWMLMTPAQVGYWIGFLQGGGIPQWGVVGVDWSGGNRWGGVPGEAGAGGLAGDELSRGPTGATWPTGSFPGQILPDGPVD